MSLQEDRQKEMDLEALIESLLFVADRPVSVDDLAMALERTAQEIETTLVSLDEHYQSRGIRLQRHSGRLQLVSAPEAGAYIEHFLGLEISGRLSPASLEALSIAAYRQPVTRAQVEAIRGVNSDSVLRSLVRRGLLEEVGRAETVGHPILYGTTFEFLQQFGLQSVRDLPEWTEIEQELAEREDMPVE